MGVNRVLAGPDAVVPNAMVKKSRPKGNGSHGTWEASSLEHH